MGEPGDQETRGNALNFLRLVLATMVIAAHSWNLTGAGNVATFHLGSVAVTGFFAISGYLIAGSRIRTSLAPYLWRRFLRIMPGYWMVLLVVAVVIAPVSSALRGLSYDWASAGTYITRNAWLVQGQEQIGESLAGAPYPDVWNGSLWTLPYEGFAYLAAGLLLSSTLLRGKTGGISMFAAMTVLAAAQWLFDVLPTFEASISRLCVFFAAGMMLRLAGVRVGQLSGRTVTIAAVTVFLALAGGASVYFVIAPLPFAVVLLWLGARLPMRWGARNDVSYGMYIYAFPLQQALIAAGVAAALGSAVFALVSTAVTVPFAWASWALVERPAMRLKGRARVPETPAPVLTRG